MVTVLSHSLSVPSNIPSLSLYRCEYIAYRGFYRTAYARISHGTLTDTELQLGQFVLPKHGVEVTNESEGERYLRAWKEDLPEVHVRPPNLIETYMFWTRKLTKLMVDGCSGYLVRICLVRAA